MKNQNENNLKDIEDSFFYDEFKNPSQFWQKYIEYDEEKKEDDTILMGKLYLKSLKNKKWIAYHFELYSDKLIKIDLSLQQ